MLAAQRAMYLQALRVASQRACASGFVKSLLKRY
jgi:hypothetical protein